MSAGQGEWYCRVIGRFFLVDFNDPPCFYTSDQGTGGPMKDHEKCGSPGKHERAEELPLNKQRSDLTLNKHEKDPIAPVLKERKRYHNWEFCSRPGCNDHW